MTILKLYEYPHPVLKKKTEKVDKVDDEIRKFLDDMLETMYATNGCGLAAPQVGVSKRVVVIDIAHEGEEPAPIYMVNPEIVWKSEETEICEEGCLSVPGVYVLTKRPYKVKATAFDRNGNLFEIEAEDFMARAICHELDHLDGHLMLERGRILSEEELREMMSDGEDNE